MITQKQLLESVSILSCMKVVFKGAEIKLKQL